MSHTDETHQNTHQAVRDFAFRQVISRICDCDGWDDGHDYDCPAMGVVRLAAQAPAFEVGTRVFIQSENATATILGPDGVDGEAVAVLFDKPWPRHYQDGVCATLPRCCELLDGDA